MIKRFLLAVTISLNAACTHFTIERGDTTETGSSQEYKLQAYFWGLFDGATLPIPACPDGSVKDVHFWMRTPDVLVSMITLGGYVPHRAVVTCAKFRNMNTSDFD